VYEKVRVTSGMSQGSVKGPLLFLAYVNGIWRKSESNIQLFSFDCRIYMKIMDRSDIDNLQTDLNRLGKWVVENEDKSKQNKAVGFTKARVKDQR
jgi:hypothetical protein